MSTQHPELIITPSEAQYRQLCEDLEILRNAGVESNTAAIVAAVRAEAAKVAPKRLRSAA